jgi:hypothetical protein
MYRKVWDQCRSSVCSIDFISNAGTKIISFTGFKVKKYLITDDVIDKFTKPAEIVIKFAEAGSGSTGCIRMRFKEFMSSKIRVGESINPGFVMFEIKNEVFRSIPPLLCSKKINHRIGHPIAVLGYELDQDHLSLKTGIISALFRHNDGFNTIQVDCSIKQGNAGSPLICAETYEVIGVIGHRLASIARSYQEMMRIINTNLQVLKEAEGKIDMEDIDPIQVLIANQNQIKHMATEFFKTANMRVGYAAELCNLADYCPDLEEDISSIETEINLDN